MLNRGTPIQDALLLAKYPTLKKYLARIGARTRNFRSHAVQIIDEDSGYWRDRVRIKVAKDGAIEVEVHHKRGEEELNEKDFEPTADEQEKIKEEVAKAPLPNSITASDEDLPPDLIDVDPGEFFRYLDESGKRTLMIQWRKLDEEFRTYYVPYSYWSDGVWRKAEPDGLLPLYGLNQLAHGYEGRRWFVMLHEGAKCARHVRRLVDAKTPHPWIGELDRYTHLGWPGGVNSADRVDWEPIKRLAADTNIAGTHVDRRIVLVCDHDVAGENVASTISRILQCGMLAVKFNDDFAERRPRRRLADARELAA